jgi:hypothetical protein
VAGIDICQHLFVCFQYLCVRGGGLPARGQEHAQSLVVGVGCATAVGDTSGGGWLPARGQEHAQGLVVGVGCATAVGDTSGGRGCQQGSRSKRTVLCSIVKGAVQGTVGG